MAVATTGVVDYKIYDGSVSGDQFASFVTEMQNVATSHTHILMDNASIHKTATVKASILTRNLRVIYNAPYTPDFNPIENVFGVLKTLYRRLHDSSYTLTAKVESVINVVRNRSNVNTFEHAWTIMRAHV